MWSRIFARRSSSTPASRLYAIGDIHGRLDLFKAIIGLIRRDVEARDSKSTKVIVLGDFIDRGPDSAAMIDLLMQLRREPNLIVLKGNHEAAMVDALEGDFAALDLWIEHGGLATLASLGVDIATLDIEDSQNVLRVARKAVPKSTLAWLSALPTYAEFDRYYFVHAGVRPSVPLSEQNDEDRLWIGEEFTSSLEDHGAIIVHGHTINEDGVVFAPNRIGVDTGAYRTGRLCAVALDTGEAWVLTATDAGSQADP